MNNLMEECDSVVTLARFVNKTSLTHIPSLENNNFTSSHRQKCHVEAVGSSTMYQGKWEEPCPPYAWDDVYTDLSPGCRPLLVAV